MPRVLTMITGRGCSDRSRHDLLLDRVRCQYRNLSKSQVGSRECSGSGDRRRECRVRLGCSHVLAPRSRCECNDKIVHASSRADRTSWFLPSQWSGGGLPNHGEREQLPRWKRGTSISSALRNMKSIRRLSEQRADEQSLSSFVPVYLTPKMKCKVIILVSSIIM